MLALPSEKRYTYLLAISFIPFCCLTRRRRPCHGLSPSHLEQPGSRGPRPTPMVRRSCSAGISHSPLYLFEGNIATTSWVFFTVFLPARVKNILFRRTLLKTVTFFCMTDILQKEGLPLHPLAGGRPPVIWVAELFHLGHIIGP